MSDQEASTSGAAARPKRNTTIHNYKLLNEGVSLPISSPSGSEFDYDSAASQVLEIADEQPYNISSENEAEAEMSKIQELFQLRQEKEMLNKSYELQNMRQELAEERKAVQKLRGKCSTGKTLNSAPKTKVKTKKSTAKSSEDIQIQDLRTNKDLRTRVRQELINL